MQYTDGVLLHNPHLQQEQFIHVTEIYISTEMLLTKTPLVVNTSSLANALVGVCGA